MPRPPRLPPGVAIEALIRLKNRDGNKRGVGHWERPKITLVTHAGREEKWPDEAPLLIGKCPKGHIWELRQTRKRPVRKLLTAQEVQKLIDENFRNR